MEEMQRKTKAEISVGEYYKRIFVFGGVAILFAALYLGATVLATNLGVADKFAFRRAISATALAAPVVVWLFPAFCVDVLKPSPALATIASFFCVLLACFVTATFGPRLIFEVEDGKRFVVANGWTEKAVVWSVVLLYVVWLFTKLCNNNVFGSARRLSGAIFAAAVVPAILGPLAWTALGASGTFVGPTADFYVWWFYPCFFRPAFIALGAGAATFGVFAFVVCGARREIKREPGMSEVVENANVENDEGASDAVF